MVLLVTSCGSNPYQVSNITYAFSHANPGNIETISFDLNQPATSVIITLNDGITNSACNNFYETHWECPLQDEMSADAVSMQVFVSK